MPGMTATTAPLRDGRLGVEDPATGQLIREVPIASGDAVREMAARARQAQRAWAEAGLSARADVFAAARRWLIANQDRVRSVICSETGKTHDDAQVEVTVAAQSFAFWARHAEKYLADERLRTASPLAFGRRVTIRYAPLGLVGVIGPWNYPLVNAFCDCVPALMAGNAVIMKPSEVTPLTGLLCKEMMDAAGAPPGVFEVAVGARETGEALVDEVDFVMFTGSTRTGQAVMERAARTLTPVSLELGGKDPMIVCADADVERAANAAAYYGLNNAGQVCISIERVYVEAPVYDEFVKRLVENVKALRQGPPSAPGEVEIGAVTSPPQVEIIDAHVRDAREKGAAVLTGGRPREGDGRFYEPTVMVGVDHSMACMREETFGPTIPVMRVADTEEAVRLANDSRYGLQASVFSRDRKKAAAIARRLECGAVCINDAQVNYTIFDAPMGGWKSSGVGSRHGSGGIRKYCKTQTIVGSAPPLKRDLHMFPYTPKRSRLLAAFAKRVYGR